MVVWETLLIATQNPGKMREFRALLAPVPVRLAFPSDLGLQIDVLEDGATYADNARKKAQAYASAAALPTLADDSGLEVDALNGAPGIRSARYAPGDDQDRVAVMLDALSDVPLERRTARFRCVVVLVSPDGRQYASEGVCEGVIALEAAGEGGFGYDPIFYLPACGCTMAQLPPTRKNWISHRARAVQAALPFLRRLFA